MAECVVARCVQERRFFKRELQKWGKNVLYLVGLERVAQEVVGRRRWKKLAHPFGADLYTSETVDWIPDEKCCFCNNEKPGDRSKCLGGASHVELADANDDQELCGGEGSRADSPSSVASDKPLDLSVSRKSRCHSPSFHNGDANGSTFLKVPRLPDKSGKLKRCSDVTSSAAVASGVGTTLVAACSKRSYTDDELQAALRDIHSGKLGTRRAAVLYGIPRSTLRNKVYKMSVEKGASGASTKTKVVDRTVSLTMEDLVAGTTASGISASDSLKRLLRHRMAERLETKSSSAAAAATTTRDPVGSGGGALDPSSSAIAPFLTHMLSNVQQLALARCDGRDEASNELKLPLLPDLIRKLSEERFEEECNRHRDGSVSAESVILKIPSYKPVKSRGAVETGASSQPAVENNGGGGGGSSSSSNGTKGLGVTLREIIAKSITHRFNNSSSDKEITVVEVTSNGDDTQCRLSRERVPSLSKRSADHRCSSLTPSKVSRSSLAAAEEVEEKATSKQGKRVRPKRGRYRNYDRDNLMEAVRAVQRGEMSVHRAGSYYGVPHSTLEYKVKERHLLRPKKRRSGGGHSSEKQGGKGTQSVASSKSSVVVSSNSCSNSSNDGCSRDSVPERKPETGAVKKEGALLQDVVGSAQAAATTTPRMSSSSSTSLWPFSLDLSRLNSSNFFASQMMRKLQEDVLMQATHDTNGINSRDALLLNVLIRNGLQIQATEAAASSK